MRPRFMPQLVRSTVIIHGCAFACVCQSLSANDVHREAQLVSSLSDVSTSNPSNLPAACQSTSEQLNPALVHPSHIPSIRCFVLVSCLHCLPLHPRTSAGHASDWPAPNWLWNEFMIVRCNFTKCCKVTSAWSTSTLSFVGFTLRVRILGLLRDMTTIDQLPTDSEKSL